MSLGRRLLMVLSVVVLVALAIGVVAGVSASPDAKKSKKKAHSSLTVLTKSREARVVDLGPRGTSHGDMFVVNAPLYDATGTDRIGRLDLFCVLTDPQDEPAERADWAECTVTATLPGGEISGQGVTAYPEFPGLPARMVDAITGGTRTYANVRGDVRIEPRGNKVIITFRLIGAPHSGS